MRAAHTLRIVEPRFNPLLLRVVEHGSLSKAAASLRLSQSTLTRQIPALEHEIRGRLLERTARRLHSPRAGGCSSMGCVHRSNKVQAVVDETRRMARGQRTLLRIDYLGSARARISIRAGGVAAMPS